MPSNRHLNYQALSPRNSTTKYRKCIRRPVKQFTYVYAYIFCTAEYVQTYTASIFLFGYFIFNDFSQLLNFILDFQYPLSICHSDSASRLIGFNLCHFAKIGLFWGSFLMILLHFHVASCTSSSFLHKTSASRMIFAIVLLYIFCLDQAAAFIQPLPSPTSLRRTKAVPATTLSVVEDEMNEASLDDHVASKFKIVTCLSQSCNQKRKNLGMDALSTFGVSLTRVFAAQLLCPSHDFFACSTHSPSQALYSRAQENEPSIHVEEGPCLGACKSGPCIAVSHEDFIGHVSLEGMTDIEFADRV